MITIFEALVISVLTIFVYVFVKTLFQVHEYKFKLKLVIPIDEWDKYTAEWEISEVEVEEYQENGVWVLQTNKEIAEVLISQRIAEPI
jgi:hypothetical protein